MRSRIPSVLFSHMNGFPRSVMRIYVSLGLPWDMYHLGGVDDSNGRTTLWMLLE